MNKINIELKHYCPDFGKIRQVLKEMGAKKEVVKKQVDYYFNVPDNKARMKLRVEGNKHELVYYMRPNFSKNKNTVAKIKIYEVNDDLLLPFLRNTLGDKVIVMKSREMWRIDNTVFHLDDVKDAGRIFEIELQKKGKLTASDRKLFKTYRNKVMPYLGMMIKGSNADLVLAASKQRG